MIVFRLPSTALSCVDGEFQWDPRRINRKSGVAVLSVLAGENFSFLRMRPSKGRLPSMQGCLCVKIECTWWNAGGIHSAGAG
jgi:hypothetical protein